MGDEIDESVATRYYRHGEPFWRELIVRQEQSGMGVRKFCVANGVAPSTFHKRRAMLREDNAGGALASLSTPEAMFIAVAEVRDDMSRASRSRRPPPQAPAPRTSPADSVVVTSGGMRIEMTGAHADRIVRHLLGRMSGVRC
jgi:hypothetical protein